jgi:hypothetical protein
MAVGAAGREGDTLNRVDGVQACGGGERGGTTRLVSSYDGVVHAHGSNAMGAALKPLPGTMEVASAGDEVWKMV